MLKDILYGDFKAKNNFFGSNSIPRGISLFQEIPSMRSCSDSAISEHFCPCYTSERVPNDDRRILESVDAVIYKINFILKDVQEKCAEVALGSVLSVSRIFADMQRDQQSERTYSIRSFLWTIRERTRFRIKFQTNPGGAAFESTVEYTSKDNIKILGNIIRINKYGNQSSCIEDIAMKNDRLMLMYCYCK